MESQRYVTKHQLTHHFCSRDFAIPVSEVIKLRVYSVRVMTIDLEAGSAACALREHHRLHVLRIFTQERRKSHVGRWLLRLQAVWLWLLAVVSLTFQGPRPRLLLHRARDSLSDARRQQSPPLCALLFACLPAWTHHTTIHYVPPHLTLHTLLAPPIHSLHPARHLYSSSATDTH